MSPQLKLSYSLFPFRANIPFLGYVVDPDQSRLPRPGCQTCLAWLLTLISQTNSDSLIMWSRNLAHTLCYSVCFMLLLLFKSYAPEFKLYVFARRKSKNVVITVSKYCKALLSLFYSLCKVNYFSIWLMSFFYYLFISKFDSRYSRLCVPGREKRARPVRGPQRWPQPPLPPRDVVRRNIGEAILLSFCWLTVSHAYVSSIWINAKAFHNTIDTL